MPTSLAAENLPGNINRELGVGEDATETGR